MQLTLQKVQKVRLEQFRNDVKTICVIALEMFLVSKLKAKEKHSLSFALFRFVNEYKTLYGKLSILVEIFWFQRFRVVHFVCFLVSMFNIK